MSPLDARVPLAAADDPRVWADVAPYLAPREFRSPGRMDANFLRLLAKARKIAGVPFRIISDARTPEHNADVGGAGHSAHTELPCACVDLQVRDNEERYHVLTGLMAVGFLRIGIYPGQLDGAGGIHVDASRTNPAPRLWTCFTPG